MEKKFNEKFYVKDWFKRRQLISANSKVSWIRRRDSHILSVDRTMFIPDERFQAILGEADTWTLQVKYVQARDEGEYECQISTDPKKSHIIKLNIVGESNESRKPTIRRFKENERITSINRISKIFCRSAKDRDLGGPWHVREDRKYSRDTMRDKAVPRGPVLRFLVPRGRSRSKLSAGQDRHSDEEDRSRYGEQPRDSQRETRGLG